MFVRLFRKRQIQNIKNFILLSMICSKYSIKNLKKNELFTHQTMRQKNRIFFKISRQFKIFFFRFAINQNAFINQNSKTLKLKIFCQFIFAKSIRVKFLFFIKIMSKKSIVSSYKMFFIFENIFYIFVSRNSFVFYSINRIMHESNC